MVAARRSEEPIIRTSVVLFARQFETLNELHARTHIPISAMIRDGVDLYLAQQGLKTPEARTPRKRRQGKHGRA